MKISLQVSQVSKVSWEGKIRFIVKLASLAICKTHNLRDLQTSKIIIHSEKLAIFTHNSALWPIVQNEFDSRESHYEISVCETRKKQVLLWNLSVRLTKSESRYKISVCKTREKQVSLLILTREPCKNLTRILGIKSDVLFSREFQKMILVSTLVMTYLLKYGFAILADV